MPKESIVIESEADLFLRNNQLVIAPKYDSKSKIDNRFYYRPLEDIHLLMIDHHSAHLTVPLMNALTENNIAVVFCNEKHIPVSMLMDLESNNMQTKYFRFQMEAGKPLKKQLVLYKLFFTR